MCAMRLEDSSEIVEELEALKLRWAESLDCCRKHGDRVRILLSELIWEDCWHLKYNKVGLLSNQQERTLHFAPRVSFMQDFKQTGLLRQQIRQVLTSSCRICDFVGRCEPALGP